MRNIAKVTYTDGHTSEAPLTPRVITSCEEHAQKEGWAAGDGSRIRQSYYMAYLAMRFAGNTSKPYDQWLDDVDDIDVETPGKPYRIGEWPDDSLGKLSVILAHHFGGTPWAWRNEASELDWGTAIGLLEQEMERMEEAEHGA